MVNVKVKYQEEIFALLKRVSPKDLSIIEISRELNVSRQTVSKWIKVLEAEGKVKVSRVVGRAVLYKVRETPTCNDDSKRDGK